MRQVVAHFGQDLVVLRPRRTRGEGVLRLVFQSLDHVAVGLGDFPSPSDPALNLLQSLAFEAFFLEGIDFLVPGPAGQLALDRHQVLVAEFFLFEGDDFD